MKFQFLPVFLAHLKQWAGPEKIDEFDTVFFHSKIEKGGFIKPGVAYSFNFFPKDELFHKY